MLKLDSCTKSIRRLATFLMGIISGCSQGKVVTAKNHFNINISHFTRWLLFNTRKDFS